MIDKKKIYTSYDGYITRKGVKTLSYMELPQNIIDFVNENGIKLIENATASEKFVKDMMLFDDITEQVFFCIKGNMYFLDFFIPSKHVAIEIDGGYHKMKSVRKHDKKRDYDFFSIGIMTIRIKNSDLKKKGIRNIIISKCNCPWSRYKTKMKKNAG